MDEIYIKVADKVELKYHNIIVELKIRIMFSTTKRTTIRSELTMYNLNK